MRSDGSPFSFPEYRVVGIGLGRVGIDVVGCGYFVLTLVLQDSEWRRPNGRTVHDVVGFRFEKGFGGSSSNHTNEFSLHGSHLSKTTHCNTSCRDTFALTFPFCESSAMALGGVFGIHFVKGIVVTPR